jgi:hypothetical protein
VKIPCRTCGGDGWTVEPGHALECWGNNCERNGCPVPVQVQCNPCGGTGEVEV